MGLIYSYFTQPITSQHSGHNLGNYVESKQDIENLKRRKDILFATKETKIEEFSNPSIRKVYVDPDLLPRNKFDPQNPHDCLDNLDFWKKKIIDSGRQWEKITSPMCSLNHTRYYIYTLL